MSTRIEIGKIESIAFGFGGYQDAMLGLSVTLSSKKSSWCVGDFRGFWSCAITERCQWTEVDRAKVYAETVTLIGALLLAANKTEIKQLVGVPVEVTFEGNKLSSWRILTEAI